MISVTLCNTVNLSNLTFNTGTSLTTTFTSGYTAAANGSTPAFNYIYPSSSYTSLVGLGTYTYPFYYIDATTVVINAIAGLTGGITTTVAFFPLVLSSSLPQLTNGVPWDKRLLVKNS